MYSFIIHGLYPLTMPEMVRWLFWFHISASVVMWPSAASRICSLVHSMCSFSIVTSNQLSSYQPERVKYPQYSIPFTLPNYMYKVFQNSWYKLWDIVPWIKNHKISHDWVCKVWFSICQFISVLTLKMHKSVLKILIFIKFCIPVYLNIK